MTHTRTAALGAILLLAFTTVVPAADVASATTPPVSVDHHEREAAAHRALLEGLEVRGLVAADSWAPLLDPSAIDVIHYALNLHVDVDRKVIAGTVEVELEAVEDGLAAVELDADQGLRVLSVVMIGDDHFADDGPRVLDHVHASDRLEISLHRPLASGDRVRLLIAYGGRGGRGGRGVNWDTHGDGVPVVHTLSEPFGARLWLPCNDRPDDKATVDLRVTAPDWLTVASNGLEVARSEHPDGAATTTWSSRYPVSSYLVAMNISDYVYSEQEYLAEDGSSMPVVLYAYPELAEQAASDLEATAELVAGLSTVFGEYPFVEEKYGNCITPFGGGMEHQTLTSMGASLVGGDRIMWFNIHELGHQWWGDWVTLADWRELWLNEGFAVLCEWLLADALGPEVLAEVIRGSDRLGYFVGPAYDNPVPFSSTVYRKGAWIVYMLWNILGEDILPALAEYREAFAGGNATTEGLRAALERVAGTDLEWFFDEWVYGVNRPRYQYSWSSGPDSTVALTVSQKQTNAPLFRMPMVVEVTTTAGEEVHTVMVEALAEQTITIPVEAEPTGVVLDPYLMVLSENGPSSAPDLDFGPDFPGPFDAGVVEVGAEATITVPLTNLGGSELVISAIEIDDDAPFGVRSPAELPVSLAPDESLDLEIGFRPEQAGSASERVHIVSNDPSRDGSSFVPVAGVGAVAVGPRIAADVALDFGRVPVGGASELMLGVRNDGGSDLTLEASLDSGEFSLAGMVPEVLAPGEGVLLPIRMTPGVAGERSAVLAMHSNDPTDPEHMVALSGEGLASPRIAVDPAVLDLGVVEGEGRASLAISNLGGADLVISELDAGDPLTTSDPPLPASIPPGASLDLEVRVTGEVSGLVQASLRILSNDPTLPWAVVPVHAHRAEASTTHLDFPAVARTPGLAGAQWFSDAVLLNPTAEAAAIDLAFLSSGDDGESMGEVTYSLPARHLRVLTDVVSELGRAGAGGLEIHATSEDVMGVSRTYSTHGAGSFGQHIAAVAQEDALVGGEQYLLSGLAGNGGFHTNLGVLNLGETATRVGFDLYDTSGTLLGTARVRAPARGFAQTNEVFSELTGDAVRGGYAVVSTTSADAHFLAYASVVDDSSHDPTFIAPMTLGGQEGPLDVIVPVVASNTGLSGTTWRSEVTVVNLGDSHADITLVFHPADGGEESSVDIGLGAGAARFLSDVVGSTFGETGTGWLRLTCPMGGIHVSSRTYNDDPSGTYGQLVPAVAFADLFTSDDVVVLPGLRSADGFRTNLGMTSIADVVTRVELTVFDVDGDEIGTLRVRLPARSFVQVGRLLRDRVGIDGWAWATLSSDDPEALFAAHASVVDGTTGDPAFIPGIAMSD
jgi:hypothetical protein